jgi:CCCH-type zinc finger
MAELEEEMHRARGVTGASGRNSTGSYLPVGAVPRQNGVLSVHAKEFWFPECRNCTCCKGFKHGCDCCAGGVDTCAKEDCINTEFATQVATELASRSTEQTSATVAQSAAPAVSKAPAAPAPRSTGGSYLPAGAVPRQNGVLSAHAKEFWFPECRNCSCCKGFKHGCDCCAGGVDTCAKEDCINTEFATQVATDLANRTPEVSADGSSAATASGAAAVASVAAELGNMSVRTPASAHTGSSGGAAPSDLCKFYASGGCRFGDSCRFKHVGTPPAAPTSGSSSAKQICPFFLNSQCQYGDSCRKSHEISGVVQGSYFPTGAGYH